MTQMTFQNPIWHRDFRIREKISDPFRSRVASTQAGHFIAEHYVMEGEAVPRYILQKLEFLDGELYR